MKEGKKFCNSPAAFLIMTVVTLFAGEFLLMLIMPALHDLTDLKKALFDAVVLTIVIFPSFYFFLYRPLIAQVRICHSSQNQLESLNKDLSKKLCELAMSQDRFKTLMETIPDIVYWLDNEGHFVYVNKAIEKIGYNRDDLLGKHFSSLLLPGEVARVSRKDVLPALKGVATGKEHAPRLFDERRTGDRITSGLEVNIRLKDSDKTGEEVNAIVAEINSSGIYEVDCTTMERELLGTIGIMKTKDEQPTGTIGVIRDITERKKLEEDLRKSESLFRTISDNVPTLLWMSSEDGSFSFVNKQWSDLCTVSPSGDILDGLQSITHPEDFDKCMETYKAAFKDRMEFEFEWRLRRNDGSYRWFLNRGAPLNLPDVGFNGYVGLCVDITDRYDALTMLKEKTGELEALNTHLHNIVREEIEKSRQNEQLLVQQSKLAAMGEMIGAIAHQWRQPLNTINALLMDVKDSYEHGELSKAYFEEHYRQVKIQIDFMSKTIDDFRNFFKPSKEKVLFDVAESIKDVFSVINTELVSKGILLDFHGCDNSMEVSGYPNEFKQVIINIILNARDAILRQQSVSDDYTGAIDVSLECLKESISIAIKDNGGGIPGEIADKVFDPYFTTKEGSGGTGIGLYMSKTIIENNMGGRLFFEKIKWGTIFRIILRREAR